MANSGSSTPPNMNSESEQVPSKKPKLEFEENSKKTESEESPWWEVNDQDDEEYTKWYQKAYMAALEASQSKTKAPKLNFIRINIQEQIDDAMSDAEKTAKAQKQLTELMKPLECKLCNAVMNTNAQAQKHYLGNPHKKKVVVFLTEKSKMIKSESSQDVSSTVVLHERRMKNKTIETCCEVCNVWFTSKKNAEDHYTGKKHKRAVGDGFSRSPKKPKAEKNPIDPSGRYGIGLGFIKDETNKNDEKNLEIPLSSPENSFECHIKMSPKKPKVEKNLIDPSDKNSIGLGFIKVETNNENDEKNFEIPLLSPKNSFMQSPVYPTTPRENSVTQSPNFPTTPENTAMKSLNYSKTLNENSFMKSPIKNQSMYLPIDTKPPIENLVRNENPLRCDICNVTANREDQLESHVRGEKHRKMLRLLSLPVTENQPVAKREFSKNITPSGKFYCTTCKITTNSDRTFSQHLTSKKHKSKLERQLSQKTVI